MKNGGKILTRPSRQNIYYFPGHVGSLREENIKLEIKGVRR
jgi:hypothetical protein